MRHLLCMALLTGCSTGAVGRWEILSVNIGDVSVADAGFVDITGLEADRLYEDDVVLLRYAWRPSDETFIPDPTPDIISASTNPEDLVEGEDSLKLDYPLANGGGLSTALSVLARTSAEMVLEDPDFDSGKGMTWLLSRSGTLSEDSDPQDSDPQDSSPGDSGQ